VDSVSLHDGKWLNGSDVKGQYLESSHKSVLHIFDKDSKIALGHKFMEKSKLSEIPALNEILKDKTFSNSGQIYTTDALHTQTTSLNIINDNNEYFLAKVKANQKLLKDKLIFTIGLFHKPTDLKSGEVKEAIQYLIANFKDKTSHQFHDMILAHWRVETFHYHKDMLTCEDDHICYVNPFAMTILRSFAINLYQIYFNNNKNIILDDEIVDKANIANIKRICHHNDKFTLDIFEI
jgi:hypothetical protein